MLSKIIKEDVILSDIRVVTLGASGMRLALHSLAH